MEPFNLIALTDDHRAAREREARSERLWRRGRQKGADAPAAAAKQPCQGHLRHAPGHPSVS